MHSAEARDTVVARVNAAYAEHSTLEDWPVKAKWDISAPVAAPYGEKEYVAALYVLCIDGVPTGVTKDNELVGDRVGPETPPSTGKVLKAGS